MTRGCPTTLERIMRVLQNNPGKWMTAAEIASLCKWKYISTQDVRANLRDDTLPIEWKDVSTNSHPSLQYRYRGVTE